MYRYPNTVEIIESRLSCNCTYVKEKLDSTIRREFWCVAKRVSAITDENLEEVTKSLKSDLTFEFLPFDGHNVTSGGYGLFECSINICGENSKLQKFPIWNRM